MGGKKGTLACGVYLLLGAVGLPVFSGFQGGPGVLLGPTGGYLLGFLLLALCYWLLQKKLGPLPALLLGLLLCYGCGTAWFYWMYGGSLWAVLMNCVIPYLIPDGIKLLLAVTVRKRLRL
jgi:biotin transport system substrate-specific component